MCDEKPNIYQIWALIRQGFKIVSATSFRIFFLTRLHSSRMRTARTLTVSPSMLCSGRGVPGQGGCTWSGRVYLVWGVYLVPGGYLVWGGVCSEGCTWPWGGGGCTWSGGVAGPGGSAPGGVSPLGGVPGQVLPPPLEQNEWQTHVKT